jgi:DNA-binding GntR family transcriptional regulator
MPIPETSLLSEEENFEGSRTLADQAATRLREAILSGRLAPNTSLSLKVLAANLGMSPTPIREALTRLAAEGLVQLDKFRGARIARLALDDLRDTYSLRIVLETEAMRRAATNVSEVSLAFLTRILNDYQLAHEQERRDIAQRRHRDFHFGLYALAGSPWLIRLIEPLWQNSQRYQRIASSLRGSTQNRAQEHWNMLEAWRAGNPEAAGQMMARHLQHSVELVTEFLKEKQ